MNQERRNDIAEQLEAKAESILAGELGPEDHGGDNERWAVDLRCAADKLRANILADMTQSEIGETQYGSDIENEELAEINNAKSDAVLNGEVIVDKPQLKTFVVRIDVPVDAVDEDAAQSIVIDQANNTPNLNGDVLEIETWEAQE